MYVTTFTGAEQVDVSLKPVVEVASAETLAIQIPLQPGLGDRLALNRPRREVLGENAVASSVSHSTHLGPRPFTRDSILDGRS